MGAQDAAEFSICKRHQKRRPTSRWRNRCWREAKALRINISQAAEAGVARAVAERRAELWLQENREAIESSNAYVEKHGLPLEKFRTF